jgi:cation diffusion facilitator CzcD-associated flavoprotein CzcO
MAGSEFEVVVVGAGLSGVGAGCHFQMSRPGMDYVVLEGRDRIGGTWDLFRYPGVRSDSDMFTLGYSFKPWRAQKEIADGPDILAYVEEAAREHDVERHIRFRRKVTGADWSSATQRWRVEAVDGATGERERYDAKFLLLAAGYYRYDAGYTPDFPGLASYQGRVIHPQHWTEDIDYQGKRVLLIGSGATAVTLAPALAEKAALVTMLQRSPTYIAPRPAADPLADALRRRLPSNLAYALIRWRNILRGAYLFSLCKRKPDYVKKLLSDAAHAYLGPDYDVAKHFKPRYNPWDQRLCLAPDGDFYMAIRKGKAEVVTDEIETFTDRGVRLKSGAELEADLVVTATGLVLQPFGGLRLSIDGAEVDPASLTAYRGFMYSGVPNLASIFGYTNASWTLRADLVCEQVCKLLALMERKGYSSCAPQFDGTMPREPWIDFSSGYFQRAAGKFPTQGTREPWRLNQNYFRDLLSVRFRQIEDGVLHFVKADERSAAVVAAKA